MDQDGGEEMAPSQSSSYSTAVVDDPHFEQVGNELKEIQAKVDSLLFGSVFLRLPKGLSDDDKLPQIPEDTLNLSETLATIDETLGRCDELEDRLKEMLDNGNQNVFEDQIEDYLRDIEEACKTLRTLKPTLTPELLRDGEPGKTDVSWLSWRRNTLGSKLHHEINELQDIDTDDNNEKNNNTSGEANADDDGAETTVDPAVSRLEAHQKRLSALIATAHMLLQSAQYLSWFTRRVVDFNEQLPEFDRDFTVNLVSQWVQEETNKVLEHHKNCINLSSEVENKLKEKKKQT